jgi:Putative restriction endonuclease
VVSADSVTRDRETKPVKYARAGIPHYWRVESDNGHPVVYAYELDPATGAYGGAGVFRDRMKVSAPFDMDLDLTKIMEQS